MKESKCEYFVQTFAQNPLLFGKIFISLRRFYHINMRQDKATRLEVIKMIISSQELETQEELLQALKTAGFASTQATLSRDLRQLNISKGQAEQGHYIYMLPEQKRYQRVSDTRATVQQFNKLGVLSIKFSGNLAVISTPPGHASHVAYDIDHAQLPDVLGTIAGDDTVLIVLDENADRRQALNAIAELHQS